MYRCEKHGVLESEWCEACEKIITCDCSGTETTRFKDLIYDCEQGERTITIYIDYCGVCGEPKDVRF